VYGYKPDFGLDLDGYPKKLVFGLDLEGGN
jgi:hypothetical protein